MKKNLFLILFFALVLFQSKIGAHQLFKNSDFEEIDSISGKPIDWIFLRAPIFSFDGSESFSGRSAVKVSLAHQFGQWIPVLGGTQWTIGCWARAEYDIDSINTGCRFYSEYGGNQVRYCTNYQSLGLNYEYRLGSNSAPLEARYGFFPAQSGSIYHWIWCDLFELFEERIKNGSFEYSLDEISPAEWKIVGHPIWDRSGSFSRNGDSAVLCDNDNYFYQDFSATPYGKTYHLFLCAFSPFTTEETSIYIDWFDEQGSQITSTSLTLLPQNNYQEYSFDFTPPEGSVLGRLNLSPPPPAELWFDGVNLFWTSATPNLFSPNGDNLLEKTTFSFFSDSPATYSLSLKDSGGVTKLTLRENEAISTGVKQIEWDGRGESGEILSPATYNFFLTLSHPDLGIIKIDHPVVLRDEPFYTTPTKTLANFFPRGLWMYGGFSKDEIDYDKEFLRIKGAGFNLAILDWLRLDSWEEVLSIGDFYNIKVIPHHSEIDSIVRTVNDYEFLPEDTLKGIFDNLSSLYSHHPSFFGIYLTDEPPTLLSDRIALANHILNYSNPQLTGICSFETGFDLENEFEKIQFKTLMLHNYPILRSKIISPNIFDEMIQAINLCYTIADKLKIPFWFLGQAFGSEYWAIPSLEDLRCIHHIALAGGVKGLLYFMYHTGGDLRNLLDWDWNPTSRFDTLKKLWQETSAYESLLLSAKRINPFFTVSEPIYANAFQSPKGDLYIYLVNKDTLNIQTPLVSLDGCGYSVIFDLKHNHSIPHYFKTNKTNFELFLGPGEGLLLMVQ